MGIALFFQFFLFGICFMNHKHGALWLLRNYKLYTICTLILSNPLHIIIGSRLIFIQSKI
jgi:hypothetical protein